MRDKNRTHHVIRRIEQGGIQYTLREDDELTSIESYRFKKVAVIRVGDLRVINEKLYRVSLIDTWLGEPGEAVITWTPYPEPPSVQVIYQTSSDPRQML